jgi:very-short-patch-repair endonuclease
MTELYNRTSEKAKRRLLRQSIPPAEQRIWGRLRCRQLANCRFRRQYSIAKFVVDFYAPELKLAIEIDGPSHYLPGVSEYDTDRQTYLEATGTTFLRFTNCQIYQEIDSVLEEIGQTIHKLRSNDTHSQSKIQNR